MRLLLFNLATDTDDPVLGFTTIWINALAARCEAVDVITMRVGKLAVAPNVRVYSVGKEKGYGEARRAVEFYRILLNLLRQHHYDACFAHMMQLFAVMAAPLLKLYRVPITLWYAHKATGRMLQAAEKLVDHIVTSTPDGFRLPSKKLHIIGQGIDTTVFTPTTRPSDTLFTIISIGRVAPVKRLEIIIAAVKSLHEQGLTDLRLRLIGEATPADSAYLNQLHRLVREAHLESLVTFSGGMPYEAVTREYQQADVMVNMSATGSLDKAVLEAMACGLPVITANESFEPILAPWADLLYIPPESPDVLPVRLKRLIEMSVQDRTDLGSQLRALVVEQHSIDRLVDRLMTILTANKPDHA
ncbi:MAG: glycosyltransferase family 4 protein [Chloroflexi bacterium]|nr:glycosyltransferase family 4 protein [Chloroflexota bacterium]MCC6897191.1 glycosyltransferase family 4 protein [Anaerolineae bacterium]